MASVNSRWYLHTISGQVGRLEPHIAEHETFKQYLVEVDQGTKSYDPELFKPQTAAEYRESHRKSEKKPEDNK